MVEVTEADRIAAWPTRPEAFADENCKPAWMAGIYDKCRHIQSYAAYRIEAAKAERDRIVAWLREMGSIRGGVADAIEALEHLEEKQP